MDEHPETDADAEEATDTVDAPGRGDLDAETWVVAAFNLVAFALPLVVLGHASGALADVLPGRRTIPGLAGFGYLWLLVWLSTRWVFAEGGLARTSAGETGRLLLRGALGGALVGMGFVAGVVTAVTLGTLANGLTDVTAFAFLILFGTAGGAVVGLPAGLLVGLLDVALYRTSAAFEPERPG